jgi:hypothetical protein
MATLYITEMGGLGSGGGDEYAQVGYMPATAEQTLAIGGSSVASAAFNTGTRIVRLHTDAICSIAIGAAPVATAVKFRMAAGATEYVGVQSGHKVAVITNV